MPILIPKELPAFDVLTKENIFIMGTQRAQTQDIRPIEIAILNLMPNKEATETQLMRLLGNSPLQVNVTLVHTASYSGKNTPKSHLDKFYQDYSRIKDRYFDGLIVTGAPVEKLEFGEVKYWKELCDVMDFAETHVTSTVYICWGAQAALNYMYGIPKYEFPKKLFGVFENKAAQKFEPLLKGMNDCFNIPHSRYTAVDGDALKNDPRLTVLAEGAECGISIAKSNDNRKFFFFGHSEYDRETLKNEYLRDTAAGLGTAPPVNYFKDGNTDGIDFSWNATGNLLFYNWLNYYVYQVTPYNINDINRKGR